MCRNTRFLVRVISLRWFREFTEFFFQKGNALNLAIAVVVGTQVQQVVPAVCEVGSFRG
jgi:large conductance mechanosensitive channel